MIQKNNKITYIYFYLCWQGGGGQDKPAWTACPPGVKITRVGGKISRDSLPHGGQAVQGGKINCYRVYLAPWTACPPGGKPTTVGLPPGGQAVPGYLAPHPGYLHPRGASCPGRFILPPPPNTSKNIYMLFCYFSVSF